MSLTTRGYTDTSNGWCNVGVDLREWCRRMVRTLNAIIEPAAAGASNAQGGPRTSGPGGYAFTLQSAGGAAAAAAPGRAPLPGGYNPVAGFNALGFGGGGSSSSSSSGKADGDDDGSSSDGNRGKATANGGAAKVEGASDDEDAAAEKLKKEEKERAAAAAKAAAHLGLASEPQGMVGAWGYPFGGPRSNTLFISRRSRRHRQLHRQLSAAFANLAAADAAEGRGDTATSAGVTSTGDALDDDTGPVFSAGSGFRLDQPSFWEALRQKDGSSSGGSSGSSAWQELSGPSDPLVLSGCYGAAPGGGNEVLVTLRAYNRLESDVEDVEVQVGAGHHALAVLSRSLIAPWQDRGCLDKTKML